MRKLTSEAVPLNLEGRWAVGIAGRGSRARAGGPTTKQRYPRFGLGLSPPVMQAPPLPLLHTDHDAGRETPSALVGGPRLRAIFRLSSLQWRLFVGL